MISCGASDIVGTCGNCGGAVTTQRVSWSLFPPAPSCESCGLSPRKSSKRATSTTCARFGYASMGAAA